MYIQHYSYDSDKSGAIDKKEMTRVMKSVYAMLGTKGSDKSSLDEKVAKHLQNIVPDFFKQLMAIIPRQPRMQQGYSRMWIWMGTVS